MLNYYANYLWFEMRFIMLRSV